MFFLTSRFRKIFSRKPKGKGPNPLDTHCEPSALYCWILEILYCTPKGRRALLRIPSTEGRSVCLCWEHSKPEGPKGPAIPSTRRTRASAWRAKRDPEAKMLSLQSFPRKGVSLCYVRLNENLKDLKDLTELSCFNNGIP